MTSDPTQELHLPKQYFKLREVSKLSENNHKLTNILKYFTLSFSVLPFEYYYSVVAFKSNKFISFKSFYTPFIDNVLKQTDNKSLRIPLTFNHMMNISPMIIFHCGVYYFTFQSIVNNLTNINNQIHLNVSPFNHITNMVGVGLSSILRHKYFAKFNELSSHQISKNLQAYLKIGLHGILNLYVISCIQMKAGLYTYNKIKSDETTEISDLEASIYKNSKRLYISNILNSKSKLRNIIQSESFFKSFLIGSILVMPVQVFYSIFLSPSLLYGSKFDISSSLLVGTKNNIVYSLVLQSAFRLVLLNTALCSIILSNSNI